MMMKIFFILGLTILESLSCFSQQVANNCKTDSIVIENILMSIEKSDFSLYYSNVNKDTLLSIAKVQAEVDSSYLTILRSLSNSKINIDDMYKADFNRIMKVINRKVPEINSVKFVSSKIYREEKLNLVTNNIGFKVEFTVNDVLFYLKFPITKHEDCSYVLFPISTILAL